MNFNQAACHILLQAYWDGRPITNQGLIINNRYLITAPSIIVRCTPNGKEYCDLIKVTSPNKESSFEINIKDIDKTNVQLQGSENQILVLKFQGCSLEIQNMWIGNLLPNFVQLSETLAINDEIYLPMVSRHIDQIANQTCRQLQQNQRITYDQFSLDLSKKLRDLKSEMSKTFYRNVCSLKENPIQDYFVREYQISIIHRLAQRKQSDFNVPSQLKQINVKKYMQKTENIKYSTKLINILVQNARSLLLHLWTTKTEYKYIAVHQCLLKPKSLLNLDKSHQNFQIMVEKGDQRFPTQNRGMSFGGDTQCNWLWALGRDYVFLWIRNIAMGIQELEKIGIYHADLALKNTILTKGKVQTFKVIDFDYAFAVSKNLFKGYKTTVKIIKLWLEYLEEGTKIEKIEKQMIDFVFNNATLYTFYSLLQIKYDQKINEAKKVDSIMVILEEHMKKSHLLQFVKCIEQIFSQKNNNQNITNKKMTQKQVCAIKQSVKMLIKQKQYNQFLKDIQKIANQNK